MGRMVVCVGRAFCVGLAAGSLSCCADASDGPVGPDPRDEVIGTYQVHCWQHADDIEPAEEYDAVGAFARYPFGTTELVLGFKAYLALGELAPDRTFDLADDRRGAWMRGSFPAADSVEFHLHEQDTMCCWTDADCVGER